jgi:hypothetical protein
LISPESFKTIPASLHKTILAEAEGGLDKKWIPKTAANISCAPGPPFREEVRERVIFEAKSGQFLVRTHVRNNGQFQRALESMLGILKLPLSGETKLCAAGTQPDKG